MQRPCHPAAERYAAKLAGLYPEDPWLAALADQAYFQTDDAYMVRSACCSLTCSLRSLTQRPAQAHRFGWHAHGLYGDCMEN